jgi:heat-inducible transcriptional repressor
MLLDDRKRLILKAVVHDYIFTAEPVGSLALVKRHDLGLSPATIRKEMADLEEMGFLEQPHTSAGRIPSHEGYRFFVRFLMNEQARIPDQVKHQLDTLFADPGLSIADLKKQTAKMLSSITRYISLIAEPVDASLAVRHVDVIPVSSSMASLIMVLSDGSVRHHTLTLPAETQRAHLQLLTGFLNDRLTDLPLGAVNQALMQEVTRECQGNLKIVEQIFNIFSLIFLGKRDDSLLVDGATNLLNQPEFRDINKVRDLLQSLEQDAWLLRLAEASNDIDNREVAIKIGTDIGVDSLSDCSLVVARFSRQGKQMIFGVLGPARMDYLNTQAFVRKLREYYSLSGGSSSD